ncbi:MAG: peptide/nickel transport system substrate-binding protein [Pseudonocardiales bacterium]|nr:peptide/nickel transport system substrate-binding protein [Pseudonocardiales bacterium]
MVYTPLLQYAAKSGTAGTQLIPGLAQALPTVSANQLTYTLTLRSGLTYSNGTAVKASDFTHAIERACKISWGGKSFYTGYIAGAAAYDSGKASSISGIKTNDSTGQVTITLTQPYGAFPNLLAFPSSAPIPSSTPMKVLSNTPPVGVGPYKFGTIVPNASYELVKNPSFAGFKIAGIPTGYVDKVEVKKNTNTNTEAQLVLNNQADIFDPGDTVPASVLNTVQSQAKDRYQTVPLASTYYFFLNTQVAPFNNVQARQAVNLATDRTALARLSSGSLTPGCFFLPPTIVGHQSGSCNGADPNKVPSSADVTKAKQMIKAAGLAGTKVTVWSETRSPRQEFCAYFNDLLNQLGFKSSLKVIQDTVYFQTIGNQSLEPQAGFADWSQDFPNPSDFYLLLSKAGIQKVNNENFGNVSDPKIESQLATLQPIPATKLSSEQGGWQALDTYVADQAYVDVYGYQTAPKFMSNRVDFSKTVFSPVYYIEYSTVELK